MHRKLSPELIARVRELAATGLPVASIAAGVGCHRSQLWEWRKRGEDGTGSQLEADLADAIREGRAEGERAIVARLAASRDGADARWLLTHSPAWRDGWSDAAAERRALAAQCGRVMQALDSAALPPEVERRLLLHLRAAGVGVEVEGLTDDLPEPPPPRERPAGPARGITHHLPED